MVKDFVFGDHYASIGIVIALFCLLLAGCSPALTATLAATASPAPVFSPSPSATFAPSETLAPTLTAAPDTRSSSLVETPTITPLPTIPTFTPTFDVRTIVTATPAPKAECPKGNANLFLNLGLPKIRTCRKALASEDDPYKCSDPDIQIKILDYLNKGGRLNSIISQLKEDGQKENNTFIYQDLTGDGIMDFAYQAGNNPISGYYFYTCTDGIYKVQTIFDHDPYAHYVTIKTIKDLNRNGVSDIEITMADVLIIFEWNGASFAETLRIDDGGNSDFVIKDVDMNGLSEIVLSRGLPSYWNMAEEFPWRRYVSIYAWNGSSYTLVSKTFDAPVYRFQALQDADEYLRAGDYPKAIQLYQDVVFSNELGWWSPERRNYEFGIYSAQFDDKFKPTPEPAPEIDSTEYLRLAAYAYYRMVILHTFLGEMDATQVKYATLQEKFPADSPGHPYVEMASAFWEAYQSSGKMVDACGAAIQYAAEHPEILPSLGSDYHGAQSHIYIPADVCPFR